MICERVGCEMSESKTTMRTKRVTKRNIEGKSKVSVSLVYHDIPMSIEYKSYDKNTATVGASSLENDISSKLSNMPIAETEVMEVLKEIGYKKHSLSEVLQSSIDEETLLDVAKKLFGKPLRGKVDINGEEFYANYVLQTVMTDTLSMQWDGSDSYFNGEGTVSLCEVLAALGSVCGKHIKGTSYDNISTEKDFFNEGYNACCWGFSSPFFVFFTRPELKRPITRLELAYLVVICAQLIPIYTETGSLGRTFQWLHPLEYLTAFSDYQDYQISLVSKNDVISIDVKDYLDKNAENTGKITMEEFINGIGTGKYNVPMPMLMPLIELITQGKYKIEGEELAPLRQVSRGELCYMCCKIAEGIKV